MPTWYTTTSTTSYPYYAGTYWSTSTTTDCSGFTYKRYKEDEINWIKQWLKDQNKSIKETEVTEEDILSLIEGDD